MHIDDINFIGQTIVGGAFSGAMRVYKDSRLKVSDPEALNNAFFESATNCKDAYYDPVVRFWMQDWAGVYKHFFDSALFTLSKMDQNAVHYWFRNFFSGSPTVPGGPNPKSMWEKSITWCSRETPDLGLSGADYDAVFNLCTKIRREIFSEDYIVLIDEAVTQPYSDQDMAIIDKHHFVLLEESDEMGLVNPISTTFGNMRSWHIVLEMYLGQDRVDADLMQKVLLAWREQVDRAKDRHRRNPVDISDPKYRLESLIHA